MKFNAVRLVLALLLPLGIYLGIGVMFVFYDINEYADEFKYVKENINYSLPFSELQEDIRELCNETRYPTSCRGDVKNSREYSATFGIP